MSNNAKTGLILLNHGSRQPEAAEEFLRFTEAVASRLYFLQVLPAFLQMRKPGAEEQAKTLAEQGCERVILMPHFLCNGGHIQHDLPPLAEKLRQAYPQIDFTLLPAFGASAHIEELVTERVLAALPVCDSLPQTGNEIEQLSHKIIDSRLKLCNLEPAAHAITRRVIHSTADFSFAESLRIHPEAAERAKLALKAGKPVICDTRMLAAGITRTAGKPLCVIDEKETADLAKAQGITRSAAAMERLSSQMDGAIVAIGNAPTALFRVIELAKAGRIKPAVVMGLPVGFVGARESKLALLASGLCHITNVTARGGSPVAAAAVNALALLE